MRYELTDYEWTAIKPFLPNKPRGVPRVNDRRVLNGIFWVLRSGAPWRDLPQNFGPYTTCYNRFVRWGRAGVWDQIMDALAAMHDAAVQMIDTSIVRVHQHGACIAGNNQQHMGRSRGGLTTKIHAVVDTNGLPVQIGLTPGETHDNQLCSMGPVASWAGWWTKGLYRTFRSATPASVTTARYHVATFAGIGGAAFTSARTARCCTPPVPCTRAPRFDIALLSSTAKSVRSKCSAVPIAQHARFPAMFMNTPAT